MDKSNMTVGQIYAEFVSNIAYADGYTGEVPNRTPDQSYWVEYATAYVLGLRKRIIEQGAKVAQRQ